MKTLLLILLLVPMMSFGQNVYIPDANFKNYLVGDPLINTNSDSEIQVSEANAFTGAIDCSSQNISDLTGIEEFINLTELECYSNQLTSLDVSNNTDLTILYCDFNQITSLDVSSNTNLIEFSCWDNQLTSLDVSSNTALTILDCTNNNLTTLNVSNNTALTGLGCSNNQLTSLDVSSNTALTLLRCSNNQLTSLDVPSNTALTFLDCQGNQLISLDLSNNILLETIYCGLNQLAYLELPNSSALTFLDCFGNQLTSLDVSQNTALGMMGCGANQLTSLNVSNNSYLNVLYCDNNLLECLNVKNGNNEYFINFLADGNPNLICIEVDDVNYSTTNWTNIDSQTSYSTDCNNNGCSCVPSFSSITTEGIDSYTGPSGAVYTTGGVYTDTIQNAAGCDSIITIDLSLNYTGIGELNNTPKQLIKIVDVLGRETPFKPNTPLLYIYNDGTVERKMIIKE